MGRARFDEAALSWLRELPIERVLDALGLYWRLDPDFKPEKNPRTVRIFISSKDGSAWELLVTGLKWFDTRVGVGGGGAIDFTMHVMKLDFMAAVSLLFRQCMPSAR